MTISIRDRMLELLRPSDDPGWIEELAALGTDAIVPLLIEVVSDDQAPGIVRGRAVIALGSLKDPRAIEPLARVLGSSDDAVLRVRATKVLGRMGEMAPTALPPLLGRLKDEDSQVRRIAAEALGENGFREALAHLRSMADQDDEELNRAAARSAVEKIERGA